MKQIVTTQVNGGRSRNSPSQSQLPPAPDAAAIDNPSQPLTVQNYGKGNEEKV